MKIKELKELSVEELNARLRELRENTFRLRLQAKIGQLEKPSQIRSTRREVAQVLTLLSQHKANEAAKA